MKVNVNGRIIFVKFSYSEFYPHPTMKGIERPHRTHCSFIENQEELFSISVAKSNDIEEEYNLLKARQYALVKALNHQFPNQFVPDDKTSNWRQEMMEAVDRDASISVADFLEEHEEAVYEIKQYNAKQKALREPFWEAFLKSKSNPQIRQAKRLINSMKVKENLTPLFIKEVQQYLKDHPEVLESKEETTIDV